MSRLNHWLTETGRACSSFIWVTLCILVSHHRLHLPFRALYVKHASRQRSADDRLYMSTVHVTCFVSSSLGPAKCGLETDSVRGTQIRSHGLTMCCCCRPGELVSHSPSSVCQCVTALLKVVPVRACLCVCPSVQMAFWLFVRKQHSNVQCYLPLFLIFNSILPSKSIVCCMLAILRTIKIPFLVIPG